LLILHFSSKQELVYVDSQKLVAGYKGMQAAKESFKAKTEVWNANLDTLRVQVETKMSEYESKAKQLSAREKELMEELIQTKQEQYLNYQQVIKEKVQKEDQELTKQVLDKVNDFIKRYGEEKGYDIIFAATMYGNIVYSKSNLDVTADVLQGLNEEYK
jgi:outer membrane protein